MRKLLPCRYGQVASWSLILYLSIMISGCTMRPQEISPEAARAIQTRELNHNKDDLARAVVSVLQEMHYSLGNLDLGAGIITATRSSERSLAPISREVDPDSEMSDEMQTFCLVAGALAVVAVVFAWLWDNDDEDNDADDHRSRDRRHHRPVHHHPGTLFVATDEYGPDYYQYNMTIFLEDLSPYKSRIRVSVQGQHLEGDVVSESGPIQTVEFYDDFYNRLQLALNQ